MSLRSRIPVVEHEVPHEPGNFFSFRPLAAKQLDEARRVKFENSAALMRALSGIELPANISNEVAPAMQGADSASEADPSAPYDADLLVRYGLDSWRGPDYEGAKCDGLAKDELTAATRDWAARVIAELSVVSAGEGRSSGAGIAENGSAPSRRSTSAPSGSPSASRAS